MKTLDLLDSYEHETQQLYSPSRNRSRGKKTKSCWREIERLKEQRQLLRDICEFEQEQAHEVLAAAFL